MIKGCLHLPLFPVYIYSKFFGLFLLIFQVLLQLSVGPQLLVFTVDEPRFFYSQQPSNTKRQTTITTKNKHQSKEKLRKNTLNDTTYCYDRDNARTIENGAIVKRTRLSRFEVQRRRSTIRLDLFLKEVIDFFREITQKVELNKL